MARDPIGATASWTRDAQRIGSSSQDFLLDKKKESNMSRLKLAVAFGAVALSAAMIVGAQGKTVVRIMTWEGQDTNDQIAAAMKPFEAKNPDISVEIVKVPGVGFDQTRNTMIAANQLPDLFWVGNDQLLEYGRKGILYDWTKQATAKGDDFALEQFAPGAVANYTLDGKLYGLPSLMNTYGYFYNADLFTAAKVPLPKVGWTYAQFFDAAKKLTVKNGDSVTRYGVYDPRNDLFMLSQYAASQGGTMFQDKILEATKVTVSPQMIAGARAWAAAIKDGSVTPRAYPGDGLDKLFAAGKVPMLGAGQWLAKGFIEGKLPFKWGFAPLPTGTKQVTIYDAVGIASPSYIKNPDAVWKVMKYLDTKAWEIVLPQSPVAPSAYVPSAKPYFDTLKKDGAASVAESVNAMLTMKDKEGVRFLSSWSGKAFDVINASYNDILSGKTDAKTGLEAIAAKVNEIIKASK
jgi:multiple sugar transport system substrate-binding protein